ncbi:AhpD family alkylhydroperoxidase [Rhizobium sp. BK512]|uniref:carboxymuconolactone decarboxylase family protein n=1 Tax=Rhizobium sp. BK512 TaxID=2587010 RepID=UPI00161F356B|nr:carboxymuconolactone decarboxylase family protein [Rhizobium sp. BK512]MBB3561494.1 AhpD family alkylhydroperoxidase [Rhizobium sp. BK512]
MLDWKEYRSELFGRIGELSKIAPETIKGYQTLSTAGQKTNHLDAKQRELIALAVAVTVRCDGCIVVHTTEAQKLGATKDEIAEALGVAISVNAGAALVYSARVMDAADAIAK